MQKYHYIDFVPCFCFLLRSHPKFDRIEDHIQYTHTHTYIMGKIMEWWQKQSNSSSSRVEIGGSTDQYLNTKPIRVIWGGFTHIRVHSSPTDRA